MAFNTLVIGGNVIEDCDVALIVEDMEVFRLRDSHKDDKLIVDFDLHDKEGNRIAKISSSSVVFVADGYEYNNSMTPSKKLRHSSNIQRRYFTSK